MLNNRTVTLKLKRRELVDLMCACTSMEFSVEEGHGKKWGALHDRLSEILKDFDTKHADDYESTH